MEQRRYACESGDKVKGCVDQAHLPTGAGIHKSISQIVDQAEQHAGAREEWLTLIHGAPDLGGCRAGIPG